MDKMFHSLSGASRGHEKGSPISKAPVQRARRIVPLSRYSWSEVAEDDHSRHRAVRVTDSHPSCLHQLCRKGPRKGIGSRFRVLFVPGLAIKHLVLCDRTPREFPIPKAQRPHMRVRCEAKRDYGCLTVLLASCATPETRLPHPLAIDSCSNICVSTASIYSPPPPCSAPGIATSRTDLTIPG